MPAGPSQRSLSELELAALGYLWRHGPCTAYRVRQGFLESPSSHWSGSSGAIYPLLKRLEQGGLVKGARETTGSRARSMLSVTESGREQLREWLAEGVDPSVAASVHDAVRTRIFFLELLPEADRRDFVRSAIESCEEHAAAIREDMERREAAGDRFGLLAARGAAATARARLAWLHEIAVVLADEVD